MHSTLALTGACLSVALVAASPIQNASSSLIPNFNIPPPQNLSILSNGSLFDQWRTRARFRAPSNNIGDPTALWQDDNGTFHISGLYTRLRPADVSGGNGIGVATTKDFLSYVDSHGYNNSISIGPGNKNDPLAVFDGSVIPKGYKGLPTLIYTGVHYLPISWSKPYIKGSEVQALAYSEDNGATWIKPDIEPVIPSPPEGFNVTGWRDPWVFQAPQIAKLLDDDPKTWYLTVSSGIRQVGARLLLYRQNSTDFTSWEFLGPSVSTAVNTTFSPGMFSGNDGSGYETSNTLFLDEDGENLENGAQFVTMGAESGRQDHKYHYSLFKMGKFELNPQNQSVILSDHATGILDWGVGYACTTVPDYKSTPNRRIGFCWSDEDFNSTNTDILKYKVEATGAYSLPRELFYKEIKNVVADDLAAEAGYWSVATSYLNTTLAKQGVAEAIANGNSTVTLATLGSKPAREVLSFRTQANRTWTEPNLSLTASSISNHTSAEILSPKNASTTRVFLPFAQSPKSRRWELEATIKIPSSSLRNPAYEDFAAGLTILHSSSSAPKNWPIDDSAMLYRPTNESFMITRDLALSRTNINTDPEVGKLRLFNISSPLCNNNNTKNNDKPSYQIQDLNIRAFMDGSFFEVYVNDVLTISTHLYYWYKDSTRMGFYLQYPNAFTNTTLDTEVRYSDISIWEGVPNIFPQRPSEAEDLIDTRIGYNEPEDNPNLPLVYDGFGEPPQPPREVLPYGIDESTIE